MVYESLELNRGLVEPQEDALLIKPAKARTKAVPDTGNLVQRCRARYKTEDRRTTKKHLYYVKKVSFGLKIPKKWFSEPDTGPKIAAEPGSPKPVS